MFEFIILDIDECREESDDCHQDCYDTEGSYWCSCYEGFTLADNNVTCNGRASSTSLINYRISNLYLLLSTDLILCLG